MMEFIENFILLLLFQIVLTIKMCDKKEFSNVNGDLFMSKEEYRALNTAQNNSAQFQPDWRSLDMRSLPEWYDAAKIGVLLHWGIYSVPSFVSEWFWPFWERGNEDIVNFMKINYHPNFSYTDFAPMFKAELFDPNSLAKFLSQVGVKYVILTSKHYDGYALFPSKQSPNWTSVHVGPKRDLVGELMRAVKTEQLKFGVYYSLFEYQNNLYKEDKSREFTSYAYTDMKVLPDLRQLVNDYEPSIIWSDGDLEAMDTYWQTQEFLSSLYNASPVKEEVVVNDRWGIRARCNHGDFLNCVDKYTSGVLVPHKWENAFSLDKYSWGYRRNMNINDILTFRQLLGEVVTSVSCGGNVLINIGLTSQGTIAPIFQERLRSLGKWLQRNGEAIYGTSPWIHQQDSFKNFSNIWYTCKRNYYDGCNPTFPPKPENVVAVYAIILEEINSSTIVLKNVASLFLSNGTFQISILGTRIILDWKLIKDVVVINLPLKYPAHPVLKIVELVPVINMNGL